MAGQVGSQCGLRSRGWPHHIGKPCGFERMSLYEKSQDEAVGIQPVLCSAIGIVQCSIKGL
jgi:hypothetical protein